MARTGSAQGHCSGQTSGGQPSRRSGPPGSQRIYTWGLIRGSNLGWAQAPQSITATRAADRTRRAHIRKSCSLQAQRKTSRLCRSLVLDSGKQEGKPFSCNILFRALNLREGKGKIFEELWSIFIDQTTEGGLGADRQ